MHPLGFADGVAAALKVAKDYWANAVSLPASASDEEKAIGYAMRTVTERIEAIPTTTVGDALGDARVQGARWMLDRLRGYLTVDPGIDPIGAAAGEL